MIGIFHSQKQKILHQEGEGCKSPLKYKILRKARLTETMELGL